MQQGPGRRGFARMTTAVSPSFLKNLALHLLLFDLCNLAMSNFAEFMAETTDETMSSHGTGLVISLDLNLIGYRWHAIQPVTSLS